MKRGKPEGKGGSDLRDNLTLKGKGVHIVIGGTLYMGKDILR